MAYAFVDQGIYNTFLDHFRCRASGISGCDLHLDAIGRNGNPPDYAEIDDA